MLWTPRNLFARLKNSLIRLMMGKTQYSMLIEFQAIYRREQSAVSAGLARHAESRAQNEGQLRRNIHRIEKGLIMNPFRFPFALDYIEETVTIFTNIHKAKPDAPLVTWAKDVLSIYFAFPTENEALAAQKTSFVQAIGQYYEPTGRVPYRYSINSAPGLPEFLHQLLTDRASLRHFSGTRVDQKIVRKAIEAALSAPSACNRQPFRYEIFLNTERAAKLAAISIGTGGYADGVRSLAFIIGDLSNYEHPRDRHLIYVDGGLSAMCFLLSLQSQGVGSCCINWPDQEPQEGKMREKLGLKPWERIVMLIAFGYPDLSATVPFSQKKEVSDVLTIHNEKQGL